MDALLSHDAAALRTYRFQTQLHSLSLASPGLPQDAAAVVLLHFLQDAVLDELEQGLPVPPTATIWAKGLANVRFLQTLLPAASPPPQVPVTVQDLLDLDCPPVRVITGRDQGPPMEERAILFGHWLDAQQLDAPRHAL